MKIQQKNIAIFATLIVLITLLSLFIEIYSNQENALVVYCSHDSVYSEKILKLFEKETGIKVIIKFDTEATKSLGLIELLKRERNNPRCDLLWNNGILGTMELKKEGLLHPYKGSGYSRIPNQFKDPDGYWCGFAARMRVYIINTDKIPEKKINQEFIEKQILKTPSNFAIAKPLYGTTLTHFTCIASEKGIQKLKKQYRKMKLSGVKILNGNAAVKEIVAIGSCNIGWTDTDDYFSAKFANRNVAMLPIRLNNGKGISIPNSVAIIAGTKREREAQLLADFLLSQKSETLLANGRSRQIPLGKVDESKIPLEVKKLKQWIKNTAPLTEELLPIRKECVHWLKSEL